MLIKLHCPNGHKLSVAGEHAGQKGICPKCQSEVIVPKPHIPEPQAKRISDSSVLAVLGDYVPEETAAPTANRVTAATRACPKCRARISTVDRRCPHCQVYLAATNRSDVL